MTVPAADPRRGRRDGVSTEGHPPIRSRIFETPARACGFLIGNVLWFGSILLLLLGMPNNQRTGGASPWWMLVLVPIVVGIVLVERGIMAMSRSTGGSSWNVSFVTRLRAMSPQTYRAAGIESGLPAQPVTVAIYVLIAGTAAALIVKVL